MGNKHMNILKKNNQNSRNHSNSNSSLGSVKSSNFSSNKNELSITTTNRASLFSPNNSMKNIPSKEIVKDELFDADKKFSFGEQTEASSVLVITDIEEPKNQNQIIKNNANHIEILSVENAVLNICVNKEKNISYELITKIGKGYYSDVYLSKVLSNFQENPQIQQKFAIKKIKKKNLLKDQQFTSPSINNTITTSNKYKNLKIHNVISEKKILKRLKGKNRLIINLLDSFQDEKNLYFVFKFYEEDLFSFLKYTRLMKILNENLIKFILAQIYLALTFLHENNILFRDLKPENVVIDSETGYIVMIDFGLALTNVTWESEIKGLCGTNEYIPPEVIMGESYNFYFDWWGFGILFYEMFYGRPPFTGNSPKEIFNKILKNEILLESHCDGISHEAKDLILSLLNKDKESRIHPSMIKNHPFFKDIDFDHLYENKIASPLLKILKDKNVGDKYYINLEDYENQEEEEYFINENNQEIVIDQDLFREF